MGSTSKGIPYAEPNDPIDGHPAADKLQAEKIDELIKDAGSSNDQVAQDLADFESTFDGGDATQVLTKQTNADGDWIWADSQGGGVPGPGDPYPGISTDDPNILGIGSDAGLLVQPEDAISDDANNSLDVGADGKLWSAPGNVCFDTYTALDDCNGTPTDWQPQDPIIILGDADKPIRYVGKGRPDTPDSPAVHSPDEIAQLAAAPTGSTYTFAGDETELEAAPVLGARVWRKGPTGWVCVEGTTPVADLVPDLGDTLTVAVGYRSGSTVHILRAQATGPNANQVPFYDWAQPATNVYADMGVTCDTTSPFATVNIAAWVIDAGGIRAGLLTPAGKWNFLPPTTYATEGPWPTAVTTPSNAWRIEQLQAVIQEIENDPDHPQHDNLAELKAELEALYNETATGEIESK